MQRDWGQRSTAEQISHSLNQRLGLYTLAAGAAGVSLLAATEPAHAEVVFTPTNVTLTNGQLNIDLNHDGIVDFVLTNKESGFCCLYTRRLSVQGGFVGSSENGVMGIYLNADALRPGIAIGGRQLFLFGAMRMATASNDSNSFFHIYGQFANKTDRFLGLVFKLDGQKHYGWVRFSIVKAGFSGSQPVIAATMTGFAYETVANKPIAAGQTSGGPKSLAVPSDVSPVAEPATLAALALGAPGLALWRKEEIDAESA